MCYALCNYDQNRSLLGVLKSNPFLSEFQNAVLLNAAKEDLLVECQDALRSGVLVGVTIIDCG